MTDTQTYDVLIAGGGLAGQTLARQLKLAKPALSVAVVDAVTRPLPEAAFKVGEATSELGAHYLAEHLGLRAHLQDGQLVKCGLRFFFGDARGPVSARPEYGPRTFPPVTSYQLDRGRLENHLRDENQSCGVALWEGCTVADLRLTDGTGPHVTVIRDRATGTERSLASRWVADCSGRQRLIQKQLGLGAPLPLHHSACWFRVTGKCDVGDLVPAAETAWHARVPAGTRYNSTNHFVGTGYWVWLIPLSSGNTSVGIVVDERIHPIATLDTLDKARAWLERHEPVLARHLAPFPVLDFLFSKEFSYGTTRFFSPARWACIGEAAAFTDAFYSPGSDFIALGNTLTASLIVRDAEQRLTADWVDQSDAMMRLWLLAFTDVFRDQYPVFGRGRVMTTKVIWDNASYWTFVCPVFFQNLVAEPEHLARYAPRFERFYRLNLRVQQLFRDWAAASRDTAGYEYLGYADFPIAVRAHLDLPVPRSPRRFLAELEHNLDRFTAWALVLYQVALEDAAPAALDRLDTERLTADDIDLAAAVRRATVPARTGGAGRHSLAAEIADLKRQMTKLFPDRACLRPERRAKAVA